MNTSKDLEKIGIFPKKELEIGEKNKIARNVADRLRSIKELCNSYNELYMRIFNCNMYYADVNEKFGDVFYYYKNNTIYIDSRKDISKIDSYIMHETIHYLQNFSKINSKEGKRAGICQFREFKIFGLGINEAIVQYITAKALGNKIHRVNNEKITICTNSESYYKYMTSLINQILLLIGEKGAVDSCINSTDKFEESLYNTFEENGNKIIKNFDLIFDENNKLDRDENKIIDIYMQTQELIYTTYFTKVCKSLTTIKEVDTEVEKLENYSEIMGILLNTTIEEDKFKNFKEDMESKYLKKYVEINKNQSRNSLTIVYKNFINNLWNKIVNFFQSKIIKN